MKRQWFRMEAQEENPTVADIYIYDYIGDWIDEMLNEMFNENITITAKAFVEELDNLPDSVNELNVYVNSPGGDVFAAVAITNALRKQRNEKERKVRTVVDGLAASAASIIIQAGDPVQIADNGLIMVHNPWTITLGEASELRKTADDLDTIRDVIITTYQIHSELSSEEIAALMDATTWMEAPEAIEKGFATECIGDKCKKKKKAAAAIDSRIFTKLSVPDKYRERVRALLDPDSEPEPALDDLELEPGTIICEEPAQAAEVLRLCREVDCLDIAESLIEEGLSVERVRDRVNAEKETRAAAETRAKEIRGLCETARLSELAEGYIRGGMELEDVRAHLTTLTARLDQAEIDAGLDPDHGVGQKARINVSEIYAARNRLQLVSGEKE